MEPRDQGKIRRIFFMKNGPKMGASPLRGVKSIDLGPRIRGPNLSERTGRLLAVSALGGFEIDVDRLVEDNQSPFSSKSAKGIFP